MSQGFTSKAIMKAIPIGSHSVVVNGTLLKIAQLKQEFYYEVEDPALFLGQVKGSGVPIDIFTFLHAFPQDGSPHPYQMEWDNFAAIKITSYDDWLRNEIPKATRRGLRKAEEAGVVVRWVDFDDEFVRQVREIFNENPIRQGRRFWHYGKDIDAVREVLLRDFERCKFIGAYWKNELIGFIKLIYGRNFARTTLILSKFAHRSKYTNNAMIAKAVKICVEQNIPYLVYGQIDYGKVGNKTLADFKINNGFKKYDLARYYVPLTRKGALGLRLGLHHGMIALLPKRLIQAGLRIRAAWNARASKTAQPGRDASERE